MVYKIGILKHFATFTGKTLRWSLVFNNVASRKISEKSQENIDGAVKNASVDDDALCIHAHTHSGSATAPSK